MSARQGGVPGDLPEAAETLHDSDAIDILIADDEPNIRRLLELVLRPTGLRIETVANGAEIVERFRLYHGEVRLVLLDVQMPVLDGPETFRRLKEIDPEAKVLFMSGDPNPYVAASLLALGAIGYFEKPFLDVTALVTRVRQIAAAGHAHAKSHRWEPRVTDAHASRE